MEIINIFNSKWLVGLEWELVIPEDGVSVKNAVKNTAKRANCQYGVVLNFSDFTSVGLATKNSKINSGAAFLSFANQGYIMTLSETDQYKDWIVVEQIDSDRYWMCVIKEGLPAPGYDFVDSFERIKKSFVELLEYDSYKVYSNSSEIINHLAGTKNVEKRSINDLIGDVKPKIKLQKLLGLSPVVIYVLALVLLIGVSFFVYSIWVEKKLSAEKIKRATDAQLDLQKKERELYNKALEQFYIQLDSAKKESLEKILNTLAGRPNLVFKQWATFLENFPTEEHAWELNKFDCKYNQEERELNKKSACDVFYKKESFSINKMILDAHPEAKIKNNEAIVSFNSKEMGKVAGFKFNENLFSNPIYLQTNQLPEKVLPQMDAREFLKKIGSPEYRSALINLPTANRFNNDIISQLQSLKMANVNFDIKSPEDIIYAPPPKPLTKEDKDKGLKPSTPAPIKIGIAEGELSIKGNNILLIKEVIDAFETTGMGASELRVNMKGYADSSWEIKVKYYIVTNKDAINSVFVDKREAPLLGPSDEVKTINVNLQDNAQNIPAVVTSIVK